MLQLSTFRVLLFYVLILFVHVYVCGLVCTRVLACELVLHLILLRQALSLNRRLTDLANLVGQRVPGPSRHGLLHPPYTQSVLGLQAAVPSFSSECWGSNLGSHICTANPS